MVPKSRRQLKYLSQVLSYLSSFVSCDTRFDFYSDYKSTFQELLDTEASFSVHHRNIQTLATEIYKHIPGFSPAIMVNVFKNN